MLGYRIISYLIPLISSLLISLLFFKEDLVFLLYILLFIFVFLGTMFFIMDKVKDKKKTFYFSLFSLLISYSVLTLFLFLENFYFKLGLVLTNLLLFIFFNELFIIYFKNIIKESERLWLYIKQAKLFLIFFVTSIFFGFRDFFNLSPYLTLVIFFIMMFILSWYHNWQSWSLKISAFNYRLIMSLVMAQVFWGLTILPQVYFFKGIIFTIFYFIFDELIIWHFSKRYQVKYIKNIIAISLFILLLLFITAQWF